MQTRNHKKVTVTLPPALIKQIDSFAHAYGTTRSGALQIAIRNLLPMQPRLKTGDVRLNQAGGFSKVMRSPIRKNTAKGSR